MPGQSTVVFNFNLIKYYDNYKSNDLIESNIVNISLGLFLLLFFLITFELNSTNLKTIKKGEYWGHDSSRKSIDYCSSWLNVSINKKYFEMN